MYRPTYVGMMRIPTLYLHEVMMCIHSYVSMMCVPTYEGIMCIPTYEVIMCIPTNEGIMCIPTYEVIMCIPTNEGIMCIPTYEVIMCIPTYEGIMSIPTYESIMCIPTSYSYVQRYVKQYIGVYLILLHNVHKPTQAFNYPFQRLNTVYFETYSDTFGRLNPAQNPQGHSPMHISSTQSLNLHISL